MSANTENRPPANSTSNPQQLINADPQKLGLHQVYPHPDDDSIETEIDIVAIHGLDTHSPRTWVAWKDGDPASEVHWLQDKEMLPDVIKNSRIFTYDWNANYDHGSSSATLLGHADGLLEKLHIQRSEDGNKYPIIFIASCFGGLLLIKALHRAREVPDYKGILEFTAGIAFLGTPFQGSDQSFYNATQLRVAVAESMGGEISIETVKYLRHDDSGRRELDELVQRFVELVQQNDFNFPMICFYETRRTDFRKVIDKLPSDYVKQLGGAVQGILVPEYSACLQGRRRFPLDVRHAMLNKYASPKDNAFRVVSFRIKELVNGAWKTLQAKGIVSLGEPDAWIREHRYTKDALKIERLSGKELPISHCYINLAIIENPGRNRVQSSEEPEKPNQMSSTFSLAARLKVETPEDNTQVELAKIFDSRKGPDGKITRPRRILIRGRAGVGKTTLCKRIVYDFIYCCTWKNLFDRILWVPLRTLKTKPDKGYTLEGLFLRDFFSDTPKRKRLSKELEHALHNSGYAKTLFVLDGLDEVSEGLHKNSEMYSFLEFLLKQPNVIITCRPSARLPDHLHPDLQLETMGFYPRQVTEYIKAVFGASKKVEEIGLFLRKHRLVHSLVRIPVQLDALCLMWDQGSGGETTSLRTMTAIYKAIERHLWEKDVDRLDRLAKEKAEQVGENEMKRFNDDIMTVLECLAFNGMYHNVVEFQPEYRDIILKHVTRDGKFILNELLEKVSFLRTSDPLFQHAKRSYHFLHLTYQEFFAAKYFFRRWQSKEKLEYYSDFENPENQTRTSPEAFLQKFKYDERYNIVWRFAAGLLGNKVSDFFRSIEKKPLDLMGPVHQRLVMNCLNEADLSVCREIRSTLETRLSQWLLFECDLAGNSGGFARLLTSQSEFPDRALYSTLGQSGYRQKLYILHSLRYSGRHLSVGAIEYLETLLTDKLSVVIRNVIRTLGKQSNLPSRTVTRLVAILEDPQKENFHSEVAEALENQSNLSEDDVVKLVGLIETTPTAQLFAIKVLGNQSNLPERAISTLVELIQNNAKAKDATATSEALKNPRNLPKEAVVVLKSLLSNVDSGVGAIVIQRAATTALTKRSSLPGRIITILMILLEFADSGTKFHVLNILEKQSNFSEQIVTAFVTLLRGRLGVITRCFLGRQAHLSQQTVNSLLQLLENAPFNVRENAACILARQSKLSEEAKTTLKALTRNPDASIQYTAASTLRQESNLPQQTVMALLQLLKCNDFELREHAARALDNQSNPEQITAELVALLKDENREARREAIRLLGKQSNLLEQTRATLIQVLKDGDSLLLNVAVDALSRQSTLSIKSIEALVALMGDERWHISRYAFEIIEKQSQLPKGTAAFLVGMLDNLALGGRGKICEMLGNEEQLSQSDIEIITDLLEKGVGGRRYDFAKALSSQSNLPERTIRALTTLLQSKYSDDQLGAASVLKNQSNLSDDTIIALVSLIGHPNKDMLFVARILSKRPNLSKNIIETIVPLLRSRPNHIRDEAVEILGGQSTLSKEIAMSIVTLLESESGDAQSTVTKMIGSHSVLMDKILEALEIFPGPEESTRGWVSSPINKSKRVKISQPEESQTPLQIIGNLYGSFLHRSIREHFCFQINEDSSLTFHLPNGSRTTRSDLGLSDESLKWQRRWNPKGYRL